MKIQLGTIRMNKTKRYFLPCLSKYYGKEYIKRFNSIFKLAVGIGDFALIDIGITFEKNLFILVDTKFSKSNFISVMDWLRLQSYYTFDYPYDEIHKGHLHMLVIKIPEECYQAYDKFLQGKFSQMYTYEDLQEMFQDKEELKVLVRDQDYVVKFVDKINNIYNTNVTPEEWEGEVEFPLIKEEENF